MGGYSFVMSLVVLAILIAVNVLASKLPTSWTQFDISAAQLYSLTSDTKVVVTNLQQDVTIYWICQAGKEDTVTEKLLDRYAELSDHIHVEKKDPDVYPTFAQQYTDETVANNSLVVESGDKNRYIGYDQIYQVEAGDYYSGGSVSQSFDGEGQITSAIDYVISTDLPQVYLLSGHGEAAPSDNLSDELTRSNYETVSDFSLLNVDAIPDDCDLLLINAPTSDISDEELTMLRDYVQNGGKLMVLSGPQKDADLPNLQALLSDYGVTVTDGVVVDPNRDYYAFTAPYVLMPEIESSDITDPLTEGDYHVIVPIAQGLTVGEASNGATVTPLPQDLVGFLLQGGGLRHDHLRQGGRRHRRSLHAGGLHRGRLGRPDLLGSQRLSAGRSVQLLLLRRQPGLRHERHVLDDRPDGRRLHPQQVAGLQLSDHQFFVGGLAQGLHDRHHSRLLPAAGRG